MKPLFFIFCFLLTLSCAFADDTVSGYLGMGAAYFDSDDNTIASGKSNNLHKNRFNDTKPLIMGELKAKISDISIFHIGVPMESPLPALSTGIETEAPNGTKVDISALYDLMGKTWQNPYAEHRSTTSQQAYGATIALKDIAGTGAFAELTVKRHTVDDDKAGDLYQRLERDGTSATIRSGVNIQRGRIFSSFFGQIGRDNCNGGAESSYDAGAGMFSLYTAPSGDRISFGLLADMYEFDKENPYFNKTRNEVKLAANAAYTFNNPLGLQNKFLRLSAGYIRNYSNIDFFDSSTYVGMITTGFNF